MVRLISEKKYGQMMRDVVEPALETMREEIDMPLKGGGTLHAQVYNRMDARRAVVIVHGYTESAEKYRELAWYLIQSGMSVFSYDARGHGRSVRSVADLSVTHVDHFSDYLDDLGQFIEGVVRPRMGDAPLCLFAHSMGGAVGAFALIEHPDWFSRAVLNAPMIAPVTRPLPRWGAKALGAVQVRLGRGRVRAMVGKPFDPARENFKGSHATSRARYDYYQKKRIARPELQNCSPTYAWVREAAGVTEPLLRGAGRIKTPFLLCQAKRDSIVGLSEQDRFVALSPCGRKAAFDAKHELFMSDQTVMREYLKTVIAFLKEEEGGKL